MKKFICIFIMCWLPLSMAAAQAMSTTMMLNSKSPSTSLNKSESHACHKPNQDKDAKNAHQCTFCSACLLASTGVALLDMPSFKLLATTPLKPILLASSFSSIQSAPTIKPPIYI